MGYMTGIKPQKKISNHEQEFDSDSHVLYVYSSYFYNKWIDTNMIFNFSDCFVPVINSNACWRGDSYQSMKLS